MPHASTRCPKPRTALVIIGLVGGVGCGKSTVARELEACGAARLDADALAHECLKDSGVRRAIVARFGSQVLDADGRIDRARLGARAFADPSDLRFLEQLIHPLVSRAISLKIKEIRHSGRSEFIVLDVPLLVEARLDRKCDAVVYIESRAADRSRRTVRDRGWARDQVGVRERFQASLVDKRNRSNFRLDNRGSRTDLAAGVRRLIERIRRARRMGRI